jgi:hypothetical protein
MTVTNFTRFTSSGFYLSLFDAAVENKDIELDVLQSDYEQFIQIFLTHCTTEPNKYAFIIIIANSLHDLNVLRYENQLHENVSLYVGKAAQFMADQLGNLLKVLVPEGNNGKPYTINPLHSYLSE